MRIRLFSALAASALLASMASAQAPTTDSESPAPVRALDEPDRPVVAERDVAPVRAAARIWVTNEGLASWFQGMQVPALPAAARALPRWPPPTVRCPGRPCHSAGRPARVHP